MAKFYYNKITKRVKMFSENKVKYDTKKLAMVTIDDVDWDKVNFEYDIKVIGGKLNYQKKINETLEEKKKLETELKNATDILEVKQIIKKLINL